MAIRCRDEGNPKLLVHFNNIAIEIVLFWNIVPLKFPVPAVAKDINHLACDFPHSFKDGLFAILAVLP